MRPPREFCRPLSGDTVDLGTLDAGLPGASVTTISGIVTTTATAGPVTTQTHFTDWILRVGLNYQFH